MVGGGGEGSKPGRRRERAGVREAADRPWGRRARRALGAEIRVGRGVEPAGAERSGLSAPPEPRASGHGRPEPRGAEPSPSPRDAPADSRSKTLQPAARPALRVRGAGRGGAAGGALGGTGGAPQATRGCRRHGSPWPGCGVRAPVCGGVRAQGCAPECAPRSVGGVGVGERAHRSPAERRRPRTRPAPLCRAPQPGQGCAGGWGCRGRGARLPGCPCNGM